MSATTGSQPETSSTRPATAIEGYKRFGWYVPLVLVVTMAIFVSVAMVNRRLNPLVYSSAYIREVAATLVSGRNYTNYDPNINWRALRREEIRQLKTTPDVVLFGGSRWWEAHQELMPNKHLFNAWASNDEAEDVMAVTYLLDRAGRLPKMMILSLRFISFQPPAQREAAEWQEWAPEYRKMAARLGVVPHSFATTFPMQRLYGMFSAPAAFSRTLQVAATHEKPGVTTSLQRPDLDIIAADGSVRWSRAHEAKFTPKAARDAVRRQLRHIGQTAPAIDPGLVTAMEKTIRFLQSKGVRVVVAQTPYHPDFYREIQRRPFGRTLNRLEAIARDMNRRLGVLAVGSYDPTLVGCTADQFIDEVHSHSQCVGRVLQQIPGLTQRN